MDNSINNVTFGATLKPLTKVKNKTALTQVRQMFKEATSNNPKDTLYINDVPEGISLNIASDDSLCETLFIQKSINELLDSLGPKELAKKFVNDYNALVNNLKAYKEIRALKSQIDRISGILRINTGIANACKEAKNEKMLQRYEVLIARNEATKDKLVKDLEQKKSTYNNNISKLSEKDTEIGQLLIRNI